MKIAFLLRTSALALAFTVSLHAATPPGKTQHLSAPKASTPASYFTRAGINTSVSLLISTEIGISTIKRFEQP